MGKAPPEGAGIRPRVRLSPPKKKLGGGGGLLAPSTCSFRVFRVQGISNPPPLPFFLRSLFDILLFSFTPAPDLPLLPLLPCLEAGTAHLFL